VALGPLPLPVRPTDCLLPAVLLLLSERINEAARLPAPVGEKVTLIAQLPFAASELPQLLVCAKSPGSAPLNATPPMVKAVLPVLLRVTVWAALVVPRFWLLKARLVGVTAARGALPVPVRLTVWGLLVALSTIVTAAVRVPGPVGANVTLIVHKAPAATELPQVLVAAKSPELPPVTWMLEMVRLAFPVLVRVTAWAALVDPTDWLENDKADVEKLTTGPLPLPVRLTVWGLPEALSVMVRAAERLPGAVGMKATLILQLPPAGTELPQVFVWKKSLGLAPVSPRPVILRAAFPVLTRVTAWTGLVVPRVWPPKIKLVAVRFTRGPPPIPAWFMVWGLSEAVSTRVTAARRLPGKVGAKVTLIVQCPFAAREPVQVLL